MKHKLILTGVLGLAWILAASEASAQLRVDLSATDRAWGSATLENASEGLYRTRMDVEKPGIRAVRCSQSGELRTGQGTISVNSGCGALAWEFNLQPYPAEGVTASGQLSWHAETPAWWIISEGDVILQAHDAGEAPRVSFLLDGRPLEIRAGPRRLPALNQAPGFWLLGQPVHVDKGSVRHFFDRETIPQHLAGMLDSHSAGIGYLLEMLPHAITLYVALHEHGHHLFDATAPLWIGESLASYLAIKAMKETAPELYPVVDDAFIAPGLALETPLPVLGKRAAAGDGQAYMQVYMGAAFWMAIDEVMVRQGGHGSFLQALPDALARGFTPGGVPRPDEIAQVTGLAPETLNPILNRYLGTE